MVGGWQFTYWVAGCWVGSMQFARVVDNSLLDWKGYSLVGWSSGVVTCLVGDW